MRACCGLKHSSSHPGTKLCCPWRQGMQSSRCKISSRTPALNSYAVADQQPLPELWCHRVTDSEAWLNPENRHLTEQQEFQEAGVMSSTV